MCLQLYILLFKIYYIISYFVCAWLKVLVRVIKGCIVGWMYHNLRIHFL